MSDFNQYMDEVHTYLQKVKRGRRVPKGDKDLPSTSPEADRLKQMLQYQSPIPAMGLPTRPESPVTYGAPVEPPRGFKGEWVAPTQPHAPARPNEPAPRFSDQRIKGEPTKFERFLKQVGDVAGDPRNAWIGMGPMTAVRPFGWGAEVLRRYALRGKNYKDLNRELTNRVVSPSARNKIVGDFRAATDIAAPGERLNPRYLQKDAMSNAGDWLQHWGTRSKSLAGEAQTLDYEPILAELATKQPQYYGPIAPGQFHLGTAINAAKAGAFDIRKAHYPDLPPVSDAEYYKAFPIERSSLTSAEHREVSRAMDLLNQLGRSTNPRPNVRRPRQ